MKRLALILALAVWTAPATWVATPAWAVLPDEVLADPALEARARELSKDLRCLVCRNESIDDSNAELARDLRLLVRERLVAGDSDAEAMDFIVERYGEFVLLKPKVTGSNWLLWAAGPIMMLIALIMSVMYLRGRATAPRARQAALSEAEQNRLRELMED